MAEKTTLYRINEEMESLFQTLIVDEEDEEAFKERWSSLKVQLADKLLACRHFVRHCEAQKKAIKEEEARLKARREVVENARLSVLSRVRGTLESGHLDKFVDRDTTLGFRLQKSPPSVEVFDEELLEEARPEFVETMVTTKVLKADLLKYIKESGDIPDGCEFITDKRHVRVI